MKIEFNEGLAAGLKKIMLSLTTLLFWDNLHEHSFGEHSIRKNIHQDDVDDHKVKKKETLPQLHMKTLLYLYANFLLN